MINVTLISYKAVYSKTGSLSYFPLFVLHHVAGLNPLAVSTKKRIIDIKQLLVLK
jgi:hypothetical protein